MRRAAYLVAGFALCAIAATAWMLRLPDQSECRASGRSVDPTERHCLSATGYEQLEEHAFFHASQVVVLLGVGAAGAYIIYRIVHRRSRRPPPTA
jgi:hypothetical protein